MKTIFVDAVHTFVNREGEIDQELYSLLESYGNKKIIVTNAPKDKFNQFGLDSVSYPVFTLEKNPTKHDSKYFMQLLQEYDLTPKDVMYFDHNELVVESARSCGIASYHFDVNERNYDFLKEFIENNL